MDDFIDIQHTEFGGVNIKIRLFNGGKGLKGKTEKHLVKRLETRFTA
jgi:hypothetical protein